LKHLPFSGLPIPILAKLLSALHFWSQAGTHLRSFLRTCKTLSLKSPQSPDFFHGSSHFCPWSYMNIAVRSCCTNDTRFIVASMTPVLPGVQNPKVLSFFPYRSLPEPAVDHSTSPFNSFVNAPPHPFYSYFARTRGNSC